MIQRLQPFFILLFVITSLCSWAQDEPANHVTGFAATTVSTTEISLTWTGATGSPAPEFYLVVGRKLPGGTFPVVADGPVPVVPDDADWSDDNFAVNLTFGTNAYSVTGLDQGSQYQFQVFPYQEDAGNADYKLTPPTVNAFTFSTEPTGHSTTFTATLNGTTTIDLAFDAANTLTNAAGYVIYRRAVSAVNLSGLNDGATAPTPLNGATLIATTNSSATGFSDTGLQGGVTHHYALVPFNYDGANAGTYNYLNNGSAPQASAITTLIVSLSQISGPGSNIATSPLNSGATNQAILGFSITTNGPTTFNALTVSLTTTGTGKFLNPRIFKSADAVFGGDANINTGTVGAQLQFTTIGDVLTGAGTTNYFIVLDVDPSVDATTLPIQPSFTQANITFVTPSATPGAVTITGTNYSFTFSQNSDITLNGGTTALINYNNFQSASGLTDVNSESLATFRIRDGGASLNDSDNQPTTLNSITLQIGNFANVRTIALFDGSTNISEQAVVGTNVTFNSLTLTAADNGFKDFTIRATFQALVTDNQVIQVTVISATAATTGSTFASGNAGGATSGGATNRINVVADRLVFPSNPPATEVNTNFSLTVNAVDNLGNRDLNRNGQVTLSKGAGSPSGTLSANGPEVLNPNLSSGTFTWNQLRITTPSGLYNLQASYTGLTNATGSVVIQSAGVNITPASPVNLCYDGDFQTLSNIVIQESDPADFGSGANQTFSLLLPDNFIFNTAITTIPTVFGNEISAPSTLSYVGNNIVRFSYSISGTVNATLDRITITGLQVKYIGTTPGSGNIIRVGGTAIQIGNSDLDGENHGTLNAANSLTVVNFTVEAIPGDPAVDPNKINYSASDNRVRLIGDPLGGIFEGNGVALTQPGSVYTFNPNAAQQGPHAITYIVRETVGQNCLVTRVKNFNVSSATIIQNLATSYCKNDPPSSPMSVTTAQRNSDFPPDGTYTYAFEEFVYNQSSVPFFFFGIPFWLPVYTAIPTPNNIFDPGSTIYNARLNQAYDPGFVEISYRVRRSDGLIFISPSLQIVRISNPPNVSFTIPKTSFCEGEAPVDLIGNPIPTTVITNDFFTGSPSGSVSNVGGNQWRFNPGDVDVSGGSVSISINYTFRDTNTGCSNTSSSQLVTVHPIPNNVPMVAISNTIGGGTTMEICQREALGFYNATSNPNITYKWYFSPATPGNLLRTGDSFAPPVNSSIAGTTTFLVTRTINGCESSTTTPLALPVIVNATPTAPGSDFTRDYCRDSTIPPNDFNITGATNVKWYDFNQTPPPIFNGNNPSPANIGVSTAVAPNGYEFKVTQTSVSGCESPAINVRVIIKELPNLTIAVTTASELLKLCKADPPVGLAALLNGVDPASNGLWSGSASVSLFNTLPANGTTQMNPSLLNPGNYSLRYDFTDVGTTCSNFATTNLTILPTIIPGLTVGDACDGFLVELNNTSTVDPPGSTNIEEIRWEFIGDDVPGIPAGAPSSSLPAGLNGGRTVGTFFNPSHKFRSAGAYTIRYFMKTTEGCEITNIPTFALNVNPTPNIDFTWTNACLGTPTQFTASTNPNLDTDIETYSWDFNKTNNLSTTTIGTGKTPATLYSSAGRDSVQLIVKTFANCRDTIQKPIFIVPPFAAIDDATSYEQNFNTNADGWIDGGANSSWQFGIPAGAVISRDSSSTGTGNAWVTNRTGLYNPQEKSWVLSQCYDFSETTKPVLAMDVWADTPGGIDGAVLQYNLSGDILNDNDWFVIGTVNSGINWYQQQGIASKPGNQSQFDYGWSGNQEDGRYKSWRHVVHKLDNLSGESGVVFRIAFSSTTTGTREGFAFDNVFIGERNRNVLVENFTNAAAPDAATHNQTFNAFPAGGSSEIIKIQFHTNFPGADPQNQLLPAINNARTAFYGITTAPTLRIDGLFNPVGAATQWAEALYDNRVLEPSPLKITINPPVKEGGVVRINASVTNTTSSTVSLQGANAFVAIVEKDVNPFINVVRQLLPNAAGIPINQTLDPGESIAIPEVIWSDRNLASLVSGNSAVIVFIQSINAGNQQVIQAELYDSPTLPEPDITTSLEDITFSDKIQVYPNPANRELNVVLPQAAQSTIPLVLVDAQGREVYNGQFSVGEQQKTLITTEMAGGLYVLQVQSPAGTVRKKVIVVHGR